MATTTVTVQGMTCGHCVASVTEEISELAGATQVDVDLASGRVDVRSTAPLSADDLKALEEAVPRDAVVGDRYADMSTVVR